MCDAERAFMRGKGARALQALTEQVAYLSAHVHVLAGTPEVSLPGFTAHRDYDAIFIGALTHRPGYTAQVGTLTSKLMDALDCDFIVLKPNVYRCPISVSDQAGTRYERRLS
jgi:nucleotide-binding universal stress UspA family protein